MIAADIKNQRTSLPSVTVSKFAGWINSPKVWLQQLQYVFLDQPVDAVLFWIVLLWCFCFYQPPTSLEQKVIGQQKVIKLQKNKARDDWWVCLHYQCTFVDISQGIRLSQSVSVLNWELIPHSCMPTGVCTVYTHILHFGQFAGIRKIMCIPH